ncbi:MutS protein msh4 [Actinomortierella ambigua]|uniref:DNA mismatch repair protein MSH3 n=1 Tax=Actinomortierella ambigua TaxID=1343610 RepID=A0A9P6QK30_9FUNG|nr:MutS protein msh4 [Actinomortierella ambigua]
MWQKPRLTYYRTYFPRAFRNQYNIPSAYHRHQVPRFQRSAQDNAMARIMAMLGRADPIASKPRLPEIQVLNPATSLSPKEADLSEPSKQNDVHHPWDHYATINAFLNHDRIFGKVGRYIYYFYPCLQLSRCFDDQGFNATPLPTLSLDIFHRLLKAHQSECILSQISDSQTYVKTLQKLSVYPPTEILVPRTAVEPKISNLVKFIKDSIPNAIITPLPRRFFNEAQGLEVIQQYIIPESSATLLVGIQTKYFCLAATAALVKHIETSRNALFLNHSIRFKYQGCHGSMLIDHATARNLELTVNLCTNRGKHSLLGILNHTCTSMGSRLLRTNILQPLNDEATIQTRLDCVQELLDKEDVFLAARQALKPFLDLDHLITAFVQVPSKPSIKHSEQTINNIIQFKYSLKLIAQLASNMAGCKNKLFVTIHRLLTDPSLAYCLEKINEVIDMNVVFEKTAIGLRNQRCFAVKAGFNGLLDVARQTYKEIVNDTFELVNNYVERYNLTLKIQFNNTMGYYLTMPADHLGQGRSGRGRGADEMGEGGRVGELPSIFVNVVKKQKTLVFTTLELIKKNSKIEDSLVEVYLMSDKIVQDLSSEIRTKINAIYKASEAIALLDMLVAFAHQCTLHDYVRPEFGDTLVLQQARHPIREILYTEPFVPNDTYASFAHSFQIITGPNMSGKSTYLRQVALLHIMAQIGSYVPAEFACIKILDQLFTRICNDDNIEVNASTFTVEMRETAYILQSVTDKSLVIVDELGRGTSTHDGMGIAFAVCEVLAQTRAFVFFATHFHELASTLTVYHNVVNLHLETEVSKTLS